MVIDDDSHEPLPARRQLTTLGAGTRSGLAGEMYPPPALLVKPLFTQQQAARAEGPAWLHEWKPPAELERGARL